MKFLLCSRSWELQLYVTEVQLGNCISLAAVMFTNLITNIYSLIEKFEILFFSVEAGF